MFKLRKYFRIPEFLYHSVQFSVFCHWLFILVYHALASAIPRRASLFSLSTVLATFPLQTLVSVLFRVLVTQPNIGLRICQYIVFSHLFRCNAIKIFVVSRKLVPPLEQLLFTA